MRKYKKFKDLVFEQVQNGYMAELFFDNGLGIVVYRRTQFCDDPKRPYESAMITSKGNLAFYTYNQSLREIAKFMKKIQKIPKGIF